MGRAIVLLEHHDRDVGKRFFKLKDVADVGASEGIDTLVAIAHDRHLTVFFGELKHQIVLDRVRVLVLVDEDMAEAVSPRREHVGVFAEELGGAHQEVVEVHRPGGEKPLLILEVDVADLALEDLLGLLGELDRSNVFVLGHRDCAVHRPRREPLWVEVEITNHIADETDGVGLVVDRETAGEPEPVDVAPQNAHTRRVEGRDPHLLRHRPDQPADAVLHLPRCLVGERDRQNFER